jgi:hypothetical protein
MAPTPRIAAIENQIIAGPFSPKCRWENSKIAWKYCRPWNGGLGGEVQSKAPYTAQPNASAVTNIHLISLCFAGLKEGDPAGRRTSQMMNIKSARSNKEPMSMGISLLSQGQS